MGQRVVANTGFGLGAILLDGLPPDHPRTRAQAKMYSLLKFEGVGTQGFCGGVITKGGHFCTRTNCKYSSHCNKVWDGGKLEPGFYIVDIATQKAYLKPFLPLANGMWLRTGRTILANGEQTLEAWVAVFPHLRDVSGASNEAEVNKEGWDAYFTKDLDTGLQ